MYRLFFREGSIGHKLLVQVRRDLADVIKVCEGELKQTNHLRMLISSLTKGECTSHGKILRLTSEFDRYHTRSLAAVQGQQSYGYFRMDCRLC